MITSLTNQRVKNIAAMQGKAKLRNENGIFIAEGEKMFLESPCDRILEVYVAEGSDFREETLEKLKTVPYETVSREVFAKMADTITPQGILCVIKQYYYSLDELLAGKEEPLFIVLEDIQDPGNLGTIMRTAEGAGITGVIMSKGTVDIYNPKTIRATMGSIYRVPFLYTDNLMNTIQMLKEQKISICAAHLSGTRWYDEESYLKRTAFLIGNEGNGLTKEISDIADICVKIPMDGKLESLNASVAAALFMYEANRQRRQQNV